MENEFLIGFKMTAWLIDVQWYSMPTLAVFQLQKVYCGMVFQKVTITNFDLT